MNERKAIGEAASGGESLTCTKRFADIPIAHRQPNHSGHCAFIHGHNLAIEITFACKKPDANGFIVDLGKLDYLQNWISENLDHAMVFSEDDPLRAPLLAAAPQAWKCYKLKDASTEGLARHLFFELDAQVRTQSKRRAWIIQLRVHEDSKNSATYRPDGKLC